MEFVEDNVEEDETTTTATQSDGINCGLVERKSSSTVLLETRYFEREGEGV